MTAVSLRGVGKTYGGDGARTFAALRDVDLDIEVNDFLVVTGRSGCGKTTLLNVAAGLATPTSGTVTVDGVDLWSVTDAERQQPAQPHHGLRVPVPQPAARALPGAERHAAAGVQPRASTPTPARERAELLDMVGLGERMAASRASSRPVSSSASSSPGRSSTADAAACRRAEQRPRRGDRGRDHGALPAHPRRAGADDRDGDAHAPARGLRHAARRDGRRHGARRSDETRARPTSPEVPAGVRRRAACSVTTSELQS